MGFRRFLQFLTHTITADYLPREHSPFLIVFLSRTGSNLLASMLDGHPEVLCHHELYNAGGIHRALRYKGTDVSFGSIEDRERDPWAFAGKVYQFTGGARAVGFKLSPRQSDWLLLSLLLNRQVKKIVLQRRQYLEAYTSDQIALQTGKWSVLAKSAQASSPAQEGAPTRITVEVPALLKFIRKRRAFYFAVRLLTTITGQRPLWLDYEELSEPDTLQRVLAFLQVSPAGSLAPRTSKQNPHGVADRIENWDQLCQELAGTRYEYLCR